jgi:hypothetical protein
MRWPVALQGTLNIAHPKLVVAMMPWGARGTADRSRRGMIRCRSVSLLMSQSAVSTGSSTSCSG